MPISRSVVHVAIVRPAAAADRAARWRERIVREVGGVVVAEVPDEALAADRPRRVPIEAEIAVVLADGSLAECHAAIDRVLAATEPTGRGADLLARARVVAIAGIEQPPRAVGPVDVIAGDDAERELVPYLRGLVACASQFREARRELGLLGRVAESMRRELEERDEELHAAALVQRDFLPEPIAPLHGVEVGILARPLAKVSGDVFHLEQLDDDRIAIFLADAVGHGMPAALLGTAICRTLETTERATGRDADATPRALGPGEILARANRRLCAQQRATTRFATAVAAVLDCRQRRLVLASAGHPPAVLLRPGEEPRLLPCDGGMLGVFPDERFTETAIDLAPADRVLLHSDGFEQAFTENGASRHLEAFGDLCGHLDAGSYLRAIEARLDAHGGSLHQADDLTMLVVAVGAAGMVRRAA